MNTSSSVWYHCPHGVPHGTTPLRSSNGADILQMPHRDTLRDNTAQAGCDSGFALGAWGVTAHAQESKLVCPGVHDFPLQKPFRTLARPGVKEPKPTDADTSRTMSLEQRKQKPRPF